MTTDLATQNDNPFLAYGNAVSRRSIVGDLLKFTRHGEWVAGQDEEEIPEGTRLIALMDELSVGWVKWANGRPAEQEMGLIAEGYRPPGRDKLGDHDEGLWECDDRGIARDPWQKTNQLFLRSTDGDRVFTYS